MNSTRSVAITGGFGFLGWHVACRLRALYGIEAVRLGREHFADKDLLADRLSEVDAVIHVAGTNRARSDSEVERANVTVANSLVEALANRFHPVDVVYANTVQCEVDNAYGRGKARAGEVLRSAVTAAGGRFADVPLPNVFGEHGRPHYNSFVATFAHEVAAGREPRVHRDRQIDLLHAQSAAATLISAIGTNDRVEVKGESIGIEQVLTLFKEFHRLYYKRGELPDISTRMRRDLFNTYRSASFPDMWPISPQVHGDGRGVLFETVRSHGGGGMSFASTTLPGQTRGEHYHLSKIERFFVIKGEAEISVRRLLHDKVITFRVNGDRPSFVDMPTMWVHSIRNVGHSELITTFWADQLLNHGKPDQYPEFVALESNL